MENAKQMLLEVAKILKQEHSGWKGDRILNAETFLNRFSRDFADSQEIANYIEANKSEASDLSGLHPNRIQNIVNQIRKKVYK